MRQTCLPLLLVILLVGGCGGGSEPEQPSVDPTPTPTATSSVAEGPTPPSSSLEVTGQVDASQVEIRAAEILTELDASAEPEGAVVEIPDTVLFDFDSAELKPEASEVLDRIVEVLELLPDATAQIRGHTDDVGTEEYNLGLSQDRADAVRAYLVDAGIDASRLSTEGVGFAEPVASNDTDEGRARNRRVEVILPTVDLDALTDG